MSVRPRTRAEFLRTQLALEIVAPRFERFDDRLLLFGLSKGRGAVLGLHRPTRFVADRRAQLVRGLAKLLDLALDLVELGSNFVRRHVAMLPDSVRWAPWSRPNA